MTAVRRVELAESWVLHSRPFRETSLIVEAFSRDHGRIGLVARGGRRPRSSVALASQPFRRLYLSWAGRGELATLTRAESASQDGPGNVPAAPCSPPPDSGGFPSGAGAPSHGAGARPPGAFAPPQGARLLAAMYLNELLLHLTRREDPHPDLFDHYSAALAGLSGQEPLEPALRQFELDLLASLGYGLNLERDVRGQRLAPQAAYRYRMERGAEALPAGSRAGEAMNFSGAQLLGIGRRNWASSEVRGAAGRLLRAAIDFYLEGRPLNTRKVFAAMQ